MATAEQMNALVDSELCELTREVAQEMGIAGAQIAVVHRGALSTGVAGVANAVTGVLVTPDTLFQIGSTTKIFTAALVMQLAQEGRLEVDTPVVEQLPGFVLSDRGAQDALTPRHLMSMSSGIDNGPYTDFGRGDDALAHYVEGIRDLPQLFPPGEGFGYSNASTCVSGRLIEHITGQTWDDALRTMLLEPAGLEQSETHPENVMVRHFAIGHEVDDNGALRPKQTCSLPRSLGPAGILSSTALDLVRFAHLFLHDGVSLDGAQVIPVNAIAAMQQREVPVPPTFVADWWGLGPYGKVWDGVDVMGHSGTNTGGSSYLLWAVERDVAIATTVNTPKLGYPFATRVFRELFGRLASIRVPASPQPDETLKIEAERLVGTYTRHGLVLTIAERDGRLWVSGRSSDPDVPPEIQPSVLLPVTSTSFLATSPSIDGGRGWALAFLGSEDEPATNLINGVFNLRRTEDLAVTPRLSANRQ